MSTRHSPASWGVRRKSGICPSPGRSLTAVTTLLQGLSVEQFVGQSEGLLPTGPAASKVAAGSAGVRSWGFQHAARQLQPSFTPRSAALQPPRDQPRLAGSPAQAASAAIVTTMLEGGRQISGSRSGEVDGEPGRAGTSVPQVQVLFPCSCSKSTMANWERDPTPSRLLCTQRW